MKLRALDQVHVSAVQADSLRPGQEFEVSDDLGKQMLKSLPGRVEQVVLVKEEPAVTENAPASKSQPAPQNKAEPAAPANKAASPKGKKAE